MFFNSNSYHFAAEIMNSYKKSFKIYEKGNPEGRYEI